MISGEKKQNSFPVHIDKLIITIEFSIYHVHVPSILTSHFYSNRRNETYAKKREMAY